MERETLRKDNAKFTNFSQEVVIKQSKEQIVKLDQELVQLRTCVRNLKKVTKTKNLSQTIKYPLMRSH